ncbi:unnamed protein product [Heterobilharzia americana]|nr:unnamed protein product [Heterobilharzia americana]CAH8561908.1 unnamed protein product [Heterobilharzia americana]
MKCFVYFLFVIILCISADIVIEIERVVKYKSDGDPKFNSSDYEDDDDDDVDDDDDEMSKEFGSFRLGKNKKAKKIGTKAEDIHINKSVPKSFKGNSNIKKSGSKNNGMDDEIDQWVNFKHDSSSFMGDENDDDELNDERKTLDLDMDMPGESDKKTETDMEKAQQKVTLVQHAKQRKV